MNPANTNNMKALLRFDQDSQRYYWLTPGAKIMLSNNQNFPSGAIFLNGGLFMLSLYTGKISINR